MSEFGAGGGADDKPLNIGPFHLPHDKERKLMIVAALASILGLFLWIMARKSSAASSGAVAGAQDELTGGGGAGGSSTGLSPSELIAAQLHAAELAIEHSAGFTFALDSNALTHDMGSHEGSSSGSGGIGFGGFHIGGSGGKTNKDVYDYSSSENYNLGIAGSNLSGSEFSQLVQLAQMGMNNAAVQQQLLYDQAHEKLSPHLPSTLTIPTPHHSIWTPQGVMTY